MVQTSGHAFALLAKIDIPASLSSLCRRWYDEIKTVSKLSKNNYRAREKGALPSYFWTYIFSDTCPPNFAFRYKRRLMSPRVKGLFLFIPSIEILLHILILTSYHCRQRSSSRRGRL